MSNIVQAAHVTQIDETPAHELSRNIKEAFGKALNSESEIDPDVLTMVGMSGGKYRHFINNLIRGLPNPSYLEVGCWTGSTLCSAISRNRVRATGIDNWSEFGGPKDKFLANVNQLVPEAHVTFVECDFASWTSRALAPSMSISSTARTSIRITMTGSCTPPAP